jgi:hypothetical protein
LDNGGLKSKTASKSNDLAKAARKGKSKGSDAIERQALTAVRATRSTFCELGRTALGSNKGLRDMRSK